MKKIDQGKLKLHTSKNDAINKFLQLQGVCKDVKNSNNCRVEFFCNKKGKISIVSLRDRYSIKNSQILTELYAQVIENSGETYISYYTSLKKEKIIIIWSAFIVAIIVLLLSLLILDRKILTLGIIFLCIYALIYQLSSIKREKDNPSENSEIYIRVLEQKVDTVNNWEK